MTWKHWAAVAVLVLLALWLVGCSRNYDPTYIGVDAVLNKPQCVTDPCVPANK